MYKKMIINILQEKLHNNADWLWKSEHVFALKVSEYNCYEH